MGLANDTDAIVLIGIARRHRHADYTVVEVPTRRDFYYGNLLVLDREPAPHEQSRYIACHAEHFAGAGVHRHTLVWERDFSGAAPELGPGIAGEIQRSIVFTRRTPFAASDIAHAVREFESEADWERAAEIDALEYVAILGEFARWHFGVTRESARAGRLRMWGYYDDGRLVAFAGIYADGTLARFVTPVTDPAFRKRGAFRALCATAVNETLRERPGSTIVICASSGEAPEAIYRRLGFDAVGEQIGLTCVVSPDAPRLVYS